MNLAERSVTSVAWNIGANLIKIVILLARSILLARLLPVETFGIYALATSIVTFSGIIPTFGMGSAFLHRAPETANEDVAAAVYFTLRLIVSSVWAVLMVGGAFLFATGPLRLVLISLTLVYACLYIADTPKAILTRRVQHRRLAILDLLSALLTSAVAIALAKFGYDVAALVATDITALGLTILMLYGWKPVWRPRLLWLGDTVRYYVRFGSRAMTGTALSEALDNLDDIWIGAYLGNHDLGLYSRAYTFATYPRRVLAFPVNLVAGGTYAELKSDRHHLSQAFFRTSALLVRTGFLLGGLLVLIAPEFVRLALGEKWLPMVTTFQLMAIFTLLDPLRVTVSQLFFAVGEPGRVVQVRVVQLVILILGLFLFGREWGIVGVAIVVDAVLLIGMIPLLRMARTFVDFSTWRLFASPLLALAVGGAAAWIGYYGTCLSGLCTNDWVTGLVKSGLFIVGFGATLMAFERQEIQAVTVQIRRALR